MFLRLFRWDHGFKACSKRTHKISRKEEESKGDLVLDGGVVGALNSFFLQDTCTKEIVVK